MIVWIVTLNTGKEVEITAPNADVLEELADREYGEENWIKAARQ